jgi:hypothetical protein
MLIFVKPPLTSFDFLFPLGCPWVLNSHSPCWFTFVINYKINTCVQKKSVWSNYNEISFNEILSTPQVVIEIGPPKVLQLGGHLDFMIVKGFTQEQKQFQLWMVCH